MSREYEDHDGWLADLERRSKRLAPFHGVAVGEPDTESEPDTEPTPTLPDADQGARGRAPGATKRRSPDAWLMEITDEGRHGPGGVADESYYDTAYGV